MVTPKPTRECMLRILARVERSYTDSLYAEKLETLDTLIAHYTDLCEKDDEGKCFDHGTEYGYEETLDHLQNLQEYLQTIDQLRAYRAELNSLVNTRMF